MGNARFGSTTSDFYRERILFPFFNPYLKQEGELSLPEAYVFETGANRWRTFERWPPASARDKTLYLRQLGGLSFDPPEAGEEDFGEYVSDPHKPVPFIQDTSTEMTREYMTDDQRQASRRPDVLSYQTKVLEEDLTLAGPIQVDPGPPQKFLLSAQVSVVPARTRTQVTATLTDAVGNGIVDKDVTLQILSGGGNFEIGLGAHVSLFDDLLSIGYGYNLLADNDHTYYYLGIGVLEAINTVGGLVSGAPR